MKKNKLLTSLVGLTSLTAGLIPVLASCNKGGVTPTPTPTPKVTRAKFVAKFGELCDNFSTTITYKLKTISGKHHNITPPGEFYKALEQEGSGTSLHYRLKVQSVSTEQPSNFAGSVNNIGLSKDSIDATLDAYEAAGYSIKYSVSSNEIGFTLTSGTGPTVKYMWNSQGLASHIQIGDDTDITMTYEEKEETEKDKFGKAWDALITTFNNATTTYKPANVTSYKIYTYSGTTPVTITYGTTSSGDRRCLFYVDASTMFPINQKHWNSLGDWSSVKNKFAEPGTGITYTINADGSIEYTNTDQTQSLFHIKVNKFGYIEKMNSNVQIVFNTDPS